MATEDSQYKEEYLTHREHMDHDKHFIGESLPIPTQSEIAATVGSVSAVGESTFPARADHIHKVGRLNHMLEIVTPGQGIALARSDADGAHIGFYGSPIGATAPLEDRIAYIQALDSGLIIQAGGSVVGATAIRFVFDGTERARFDSAGSMFIGKISADLTVDGCELFQSGRIFSTVIAGNTPNFIANVTSGVSGNQLISFRRNNGTIGSVTITAALTGVAYNITSDEELKENIRPIPDAEAYTAMRDIQPLLFEWKEMPGDKQVGYVAQRVAAAWPLSIKIGVVTPGKGVQGDPDYMPWQMDMSKLVPVLHSALQAIDRRMELFRTQALNKIQELEARLTTLES